MNSAEAYYEPFFLADGVERLDAIGSAWECADQECALRADEWDLVHAAVQEVLAELAKSLELHDPPIKSRSGRTSGHAFYLFSFRIFYSPVDPERDPVVVGVDFLPAGSGITVSGDIAGEERGRVHYATDSISFDHPTLSAICDGGKRIAELLVTQRPVLLEAVLGRTTDSECVAAPPGGA
jgi:hypothetical protein